MISIVLRALMLALLLLVPLDGCTSWHCDENTCANGCCDDKGLRANPYWGRFPTEKGSPRPPN